MCEGATSYSRSGIGFAGRVNNLLFELADRLTRSKNPGEQQRLKDELARLVFGA